MNTDDTPSDLEGRGNVPPSAGDAAADEELASMQDQERIDDALTKRLERGEPLNDAIVGSVVAEVFGPTPAPVAIEAVRETVRRRREAGE